MTLTVTAVPITGIFELDSVKSGSMKGVVPASRIVLGENSQFLMEVGVIVGSGQYELTDSNLILKYSDDFLTRLFEAHFVSNRRWVEGDEAKETGAINGTSIILHRCMTEDCYELYWFYGKTGYPAAFAAGAAERGGATSQNALNESNGWWQALQK